MSAMLRRRGSQHVGFIRAMTASNEGNDLRSANKDGKDAEGELHCGGDCGLKRGKVFGNVVENIPDLNSVFGVEQGAKTRFKVWRSEGRVADSTVK